MNSANPELNRDMETIMAGAIEELARIGKEMTDHEKTGLGPAARTRD